MTCKSDLKTNVALKELSLVGLCSGTSIWLYQDAWATEALVSQRRKGRLVGQEGFWEGGSPWEEINTLWSKF